MALGSTPDKARNTAPSVEKPINPEDGYKKVETEFVARAEQAASKRSSGRISQDDVSAVIAAYLQKYTEGSGLLLRYVTAAADSQSYKAHKDLPLNKLSDHQLNMNNFLRWAPNELNEVLEARQKGRIDNLMVNRLQRNQAVD